MAVKVTVYGEAKLEQIERARTELQKLEDQVRRNATGVSGALTRAGEAMQAVGGQMQAVGMSATRNVTVPIAAAGFALFKMTQAAAEDAQAQALLANTLTNTAGATSASIAATEEWIAAQGRALGVADDQLRPALGILAGATGDVAKAQELAALAMDISAARGLDMESVSAALAKAYTGNLGALTRLVPGIDAAAMASGDFTQVQAALADMVGGSAATAADTAAGRMQILKVGFAEAAETLGTAFLPVMEDVLTVVRDRVLPAIERFAEWWGNLSPNVSRAIVVVGAAAAAFGPVALVLGKVVSGVGGLLTFLPKLGPAFSGALGPVGIILGLVAALIAASPELRALLVDLAQELMAKLVPVFEKIVTALTPVIEMIGGALGQVVKSIVDSGIFQMLADAFMQVIDALLPIVDIVLQLLDPLMLLLQPLLDLVMMILPPLVELLAGGLSIALGIVAEAFKLLTPVIQFVVEWIGGVMEAVGGLISFLTGEVSFEEFIGKLLSMGGPFGEVVRWVANIGVQIGNFVREAVANVQRFAADVQRNIGNAIAFFVSIPGRIRDALAGAAKWLLDTGRDIVQGLLQGIQNAWSSVTKWVGDAIDNLLGGVKDLLGISSPSRVFATIGQQMGDGMRVGLDSTLTAVERAAQQVAAAAVVSASGVVQVGVQTAAAGFPTGTVPLASSATAGGSGTVTLQLAAGAIQINIQGDASRDDVRGGVEDALNALLTQVRSR